MKRMFIFTATTSVVMTALMFTAQASTATINPTAAQVTQGLLKTYAILQVWPKGLINPASDDGQTPAYWTNGATPSQPSAWVGLSTVFPGQTVASYPSLLDMTNAPQNAPITAETLAQWILHWETAVHQVNTVWEPSQNAFDLLKLYSFWYATDLTKSSSIVTAHDLSEVEQNIIDVSNGYRLLAKNKVQFLMPMINNTGDIAGTAYDGYLTPRNFAQKALEPTIEEIDSVTLSYSKNGDVIYSCSKLPNVYLTFNDVFVKNGVVTGNGGPIWTDIPRLESWIKANPVPRTLRWDEGQYLGHEYTGISVPDIKNNFFVAHFWSTNSYLISKYGGGGHLSQTPNFIIASNNGRITEVKMVNAENYPELTWYGMGR